MSKLGLSDVSAGREEYLLHFVQAQHEVVVIARAIVPSILASALYNGRTSHHLSAMNAHGGQQGSQPCRWVPTMPVVCFAKAISQWLHRFLCLHFQCHYGVACLFLVSSKLRVSA